MKYTYNIEVGVDECARGVLFGRIYAAAVIWPTVPNEKDKLITDSKKLTKKKRELLYDYIKERAIDYKVCYYDAKTVDEKGIQWCNMTLFHDCIDQLKVTPTFILVDGTQFKSHETIPHICIKKGDSKYISIAAASILAKVEHDRWIEEICQENESYIKYGLLTNMGYGTKKHIEAIQEYGYCDLHRRSYKLKKLKKKNYSPIIN